MQFTALEDFFCPETQSQYCKGLSYTVRPFEEVDRPGWAEKTRAQVRGRCEAHAALLYNNSHATKYAVSVHTFASQSITAADFTLTMPVGDGTTGLIRIA